MGSVGSCSVLLADEASIREKFRKGWYFHGAFQGILQLVLRNQPACRSGLAFEYCHAHHPFDHLAVYAETAGPLGGLAPAELTLLHLRWPTVLPEASVTVGPER